MDDDTLINRNNNNIDKMLTRKNSKSLKHIKQGRPYTQGKICLQDSNLSSSPSSTYNIPVSHKKLLKSSNLIPQKPDYAHKFNEY